MKKTGILWLATLFLVSGYEASADIKAMTKQCEKDVSEFCASENGTCNRYCEAAHKGKAKKITSCKEDCTADKYCKKAGYAKTPNALAKQNKEQVVACIAQLRDPDGSQSGRRMEDWKVIQTPSFTKIVGEAVAEEAAPAATDADESAAKQEKVSVGADAPAEDASAVEAQ